MSSNNILNTSKTSRSSEGELDFLCLKKEVTEFTDADKDEIISVLITLSGTFKTKDQDASAKFTTLAQKLSGMTAESAYDFLRDYFQSQDSFNIQKTKCFMMLKKLADDCLLVDEDSKFLEKRLAQYVVMDLFNIIFYKTLPCPNGNHCKHQPRKIVHKNDFTDVELDCYYYHHEKDRRRFVLNGKIREFNYAGNFGDSKKDLSQRKEFSQNFYESLFHPLYYKNFTCVRSKCNNSTLCPYFHSIEEKNVWNVSFRWFFEKDREIYTRKRSGEEEKHQKVKSRKNFNNTNNKILGEFK